MTQSIQKIGPQISQKNFQKQLEELVTKDIEKNSTPLWITCQFVEKPIKVVLVGIFIFILSIMMTILFNTFEMAEDSDREYLIWSNERVKIMDMHTHIQDDFQKGLGDVQIPERSQDEDQWNSNIIVKCDGCNVFSKEGFKALYEFEKEILEHKDYKRFCLASVDSSECSEESLQSPSLIAEKVLNKKAYSLSDDDVERIGNFLFMGGEEQRFQKYKLLFGKEFSRENRQTQHMRSYFKFGTPIKINGKLKNDKFDDRQDQLKEFDQFSSDILEMRDNEYKNLPSKISLLTTSQQIDSLEFKRQVDSDFMWALASIFFVFVYISIHLKSIFLGATAMGQILISFPLTQILFRLVFQITYFSSLHIMAIFIVLGIAADDVFVFVDAWRQTGLYKQLDQDPLKRLNQRMAITFRRASRAMLATSSTTSAAFLATGFSSIMPISSFGFYAGLLIPVNFLLVIMFFPAILVISETRFANMGICCCIKKKKEGLKEDSKSVNISNSTSNNNQCEKSLSYQQREEVEVQKDIKEKENENGVLGLNIYEGKLPLVERFFAVYFSPFVDRFKYIILVLFCIWMSIAGWRALKMSPISEPEHFLPEDHKSEIAKKLALYAFHQSAFSDTGITLYQFWGVDGIDTSGTSRWDQFDLGDIEWGEEFDLSDEKNQQYFYEYCLSLKENELVQDGNVDSFIFAFKDFAENQSSDRQFPVKKDKFIEILTDFTQQNSIGEQQFNENRIGIIKNQLKYIQIKIAAKGQPFRPYDELNPLYQKWEEFVQISNENAPFGLNNSKQTGRFHWTWMITERAFVTNAVQGMIISLSFGLLVLLVTTLNIVMALFSVLSIIGIVLSVICIMEMSGWELGVAESITIVILIGLSIDYVVHLANHYVESVYQDRHRKMKVALRDLGISIVSGAITTVGAGIFLMFAQVVIFNKFAILILSTIFFSLVFALLFFSACMFAFGPENECGSLRILCKKKRKIDSKVSNNSSVQNLGEINIEMKNFDKYTELKVDQTDAISNAGEIRQQYVQSGSVNFDNDISSQLPS